ncbi:hypothetical protein BGX38DRAFT_698088 [Terfezia claveryi]|nr:hypothetical protein BGX38DRAFT_698088 [Terfezia claveryi]
MNTQMPIQTASINPKLDPSTILHLQSLAIVAKQKAIISPEYIAAFILHLVLKRFLSLSQRRISRIGSSGSLGPVFTKADTFMKSLGICQLRLLGNSGYSHSLISAISGVESPTGFGLADHIDGRLFKYVLENPVSIQNVVFPSDILAYYDSLLEAVKDDTGLDISQFGLQHSSSSNVNYPSRCQVPDEEAENDTAGARMRV